MQLGKHQNSTQDEVQKLSILQELAALREQLSVANALNRSLLDQIEALGPVQAHVEELNEENHNLQREIDTARRERDTMRKENDHIRRENDMRWSENETLRRERNI